MTQQPPDPPDGIAGPYAPPSWREKYPGHAYQEAPADDGNLWVGVAVGVGLSLPFWVPIVLWLLR